MISSRSFYVRTCVKLTAFANKITCVVKNASVEINLKRDLTKTTTTTTTLTATATATATAKSNRFRTSLHGGGGPQLGEVIRAGSPHLSCKRNQIKMRDCMDRRVTPPKGATSPACGLSPSCKQAIS